MKLFTNTKERLSALALRLVRRFRRQPHTKISPHEIMKTYRHPGTEKRGTLVQDDAAYNDEMDKKMCANLQDCVQRHGLGEAGERLDVIVVRELDRLKRAEDECADPSEDDSNDPMARTMPRLSSPNIGHEPHAPST